MASYEPFARKDVDRAAAFLVGFLVEPLDGASSRKLMALRTDIDDFHLNGREMYWLSGLKQGESTFSNAKFEKLLGVRSTFRGLNTIRRMAARYPSRPGP